MKELCPAARVTDAVGRDFRRGDGASISPYVCTQGNVFECATSACYVCTSHNLLLG